MPLSKMLWICPLVITPSQGFGGKYGLGLAPRDLPPLPIENRLHRAGITVYDYNPPIVALDTASENASNASTIPPVMNDSSWERLSSGTIQPDVEVPDFIKKYCRSITVPDGILKEMNQACNDWGNDTSGTLKHIPYKNGGYYNKNRHKKWVKSIIEENQLQLKIDDPTLKAELRMITGNVPPQNLHTDYGIEGQCDRLLLIYVKIDNHKEGTMVSNFDAKNGKTITTGKKAKIVNNRRTLCYNISRF